MTINHKDGNKKNPKLDNLELVTYGENVLHAINVLHVNTQKPKCVYYANDLTTGFTMVFGTAVEAGKFFNVSPVTIKGHATGHLKGIFKENYIITRDINTILVPHNKIDS